MDSSSALTRCIRDDVVAYAQRRRLSRPDAFPRVELVSIRGLEKDLHLMAKRRKHDSGVEAGSCGWMDDGVQRRVLVGSQMQEIVNAKTRTERANHQRHQGQIVERWKLWRGWSFLHLAALGHGARLHWASLGDALGMDFPTRTDSGHDMGSWASTQTLPASSSTYARRCTVHGTTRHRTAALGTTSTCLRRTTTKTLTRPDASDQIISHLTCPLDAVQYA